MTNGLRPGDTPSLLDDLPVYINENYADLRNILTQAYEQAHSGKGAVRHGNGLPFAEQPLQRITEAVGLGFPLGQAQKKIGESTGLEYLPARAELLGAIVYIAGAILHMDNQEKTE